MPENRPPLRTAESKLVSSWMTNAFKPSQANAVASKGGKIKSGGRGWKAKTPTNAAHKRGRAHCPTSKKI
jgi:hypothetical protein